MNVLDRESRITKSAKLTRAESNGGDAQKYSQSVEFIVDYITKAHDPELAGVFVDTLIDRLRAAGLHVPPIVSTPYINTIPEEQQDEILKLVEVLESDDDVQTVYHNLA